MGQTEIELNPDYVREMLNVLKDFDLQYFECAQFKVKFKKPAPIAMQAPVESPISTDVRGFEAGDKADDEEAPEDRYALHRSAMRGVSITLAPKKV